MKKEEAIKRLSNTKVYVDGNSEEIQRKLFELGFSWKTFKKEVVNECMPFLYIYPDLHLLAGNDMESFKNKEFVEIKADDILSITIDKEYDFKPFDKVLVRNANSCIWQGTFISHITKNDTDGWRIYTMTGTWYQCIPFEGNEHLVGTNNSPDNI